MARFFLRQLLSPSRIQALTILFVRSLPDHSLPPGLLQNQVLAFDFLQLLRWHGVVAPQSLLALALFKGLVFSRGVETGDPFMVPLAVTGPHLLYAVHGRLLSCSIPPSAFQSLVCVQPPLFPWQVHHSIRITAGSTRPPTRAMTGLDWGFACSAWPRLAGPAAVALSGPGFDGNRPG